VEILGPATNRPVQEPTRQSISREVSLLLVFTGNPPSSQGFADIKQNEKKEFPSRLDSIRKCAN
jgi:hypothetical protein